MPRHDSAPDHSYEDLREEARRDVSVALALLNALRDHPELPGARDEAVALAEIHLDDSRIQLSASACLNALAQRRGPDEPAAPGGPADDAARIAERALDRLAPSSSETCAYLWVNLANALRFGGDDRSASAEEAFRRSLSLVDRGGTWFDLGLFYKWRGRFDDALAAFREAQERIGPRREILFNVAITATGLGEGQLACETYRALGIEAVVNPKSGMPEVPTVLPGVEVRVRTRPSGFGPTEGDLPGSERFEVLPVAPISPCHGVLEAPTFGDGATDYGDVLLFDAAPLSVRTEPGPKGRVIPLFPVLGRLSSSGYRRFRFVALEQAARDLDRLELVDGARVFPQRARIQAICPRCASGELGRHAHEPPIEHRVIYGKITASSEVSLVALREKIESATRREGRVKLAIPGLHEAIGDTPRAGQARKTWLAIERAAVVRTGRD